MKCPKSPNGIHLIERGPFNYDPAKTPEENQGDLEKWKREFRMSDQFCIYCGEAIW